MTITEFLQEHASAVFGLVGAFGAALLSFGSGWMLRKRDFDLRLWDKLIDRRIDAHERVMKIALDMRMMFALHNHDVDGELRRAPHVLASQEQFEGWFTDALSSAHEASSWLSTDAKREMYFVQDYLVNLNEMLRDIPSERFPDVGSLIRMDFIDISASLEKKVFAFFQGDVRRLKLNDLKEPHKYPLENTRQRLASTALFSRADEIAQFREK